MDLAAGTRIDRYVVEDVLGRGGMAVVYRVRHAKLGTSHALKVLLIPAPAIQERMLQEGRVQATLRHPNVVNVTDVIEVEGSYGLVMEYVDGPALDRHLWQQKHLSLEEAEGIGRGIIAGVAAAHAQSMIHRDLKPANILLARGERGDLVPKVTDFGLAKILRGTSLDTASATRTGHTMGTPQYMAPEQIRNAKTVDERADVFSIGALLYEMVCSQPTFPGEDVYDVFTRITNGQYVHPREIVPNLPRRMEDAIIGALEPDFERRIQSAEDLLAIWTGERRWTSPTVIEAPANWNGSELVAPTGPTRAKTGSMQKPVRTPPPEPPQPASARRRGFAAAALALGGAALALGIGLCAIGGWLFGGPEPAPPPQPIAVVEPEPEPVPLAAVLTEDMFPEQGPPQVAPEPLPAPGAPPRPRPKTPGQPPAPVQVPVSQPVSVAPVPVPTTAPDPANDLATVYVKYKGSKDPTAAYTRQAKLKDRGGKTYNPGQIPAGSYTVLAGFENQGPAPVGTITVNAGEIRTVWCDEKKILCK